MGVSNRDGRRFGPDRPANFHYAAAKEFGDSLTQNYLQYLAIRAMEQATKNPNAQVIVMPIGPNGMPLSVNPYGHAGTPVAPKP